MTDATDAGRPLRICLFSTHFAEYGFSLARALSRHAEVMIVAAEENTRLEIGAEFIARGFDGLNARLLHRSRSPLNIAGQAFGLVKAVRQFAPDVIHVQEDSKDAVALALPWLPRRPLVVTVHDPKPHQGADTQVRQSMRHGRYVSQLRHRADAVIVHGERLVADAHEVIADPDVSVHVVPHGPLAERGVAPSAAPEPGRCLFFGRIQSYKGLDLFVAAIELLRQQGLEVRGVVAGRGPALEPLRAKLNTSPHFELIDRYLSPEQVRREFERAEVVLMPYKEATQSGVAAVAMGVGRPVVAFNVGALRESIVEGETGLLAPPGDLTAFVRATAQVLADADLRHRLGAGALFLGRNAFSWERIAQLHLDVYRGLQAARPA